MLRQPRYIHGRMPTDGGWCDIHWLHPDGRRMESMDWNSGRQLALLFATRADQKDDSPICEAVAILFNTAAGDVEFSLPEGLPPDWTMEFCSSPATKPLGPGCWRLAGRSLLLVTSALEA